MLTENDIVERVVNYLQHHGYNVTQSLGTSEKGVDIIAEKDGLTLYVEAKGATSSKESSSRFGKGFSRNQIKTHVACAVVASMKILCAKDRSSIKVAIALPDDEGHRSFVSAISSSLGRLNIDVFWVSKDLVNFVNYGL